MLTSSVVLSLVSLGSISFAAPAPNAAPSPVPTTPAHLEERQTGLVGELLGVVDDVLGIAVSNLNGVFSDVAAGKIVGTAGWSSIQSALRPVTATTTQTNVASAISTLSAIHSAQPSANLYQFLAALVAEGLTVDSANDALNFVDGVLTGENNMNNVYVEKSVMNERSGSLISRNRAPSTAVYPQKACGDAPYSVDEGTLRGAIYIPSGFTYGAKPPVILMPGTGNTGYITYQGNFIQTLTGSNYADPVWVNVPGYLLGDAQVNAEFVSVIDLWNR